MIYYIVVYLLLAPNIEDDCLPAKTGRGEYLKGVSPSGQNEQVRRCGSPSERQTSMNGSSHPSFSIVNICAIFTFGSPGKTG